MPRMETCFFFGGYDLPTGQIAALPQLVSVAIDGFIDRGITHFISAGLPAFDVICAEYVLGLKVNRPSLSLRFLLPCRDMSPFYPASCMCDFEALLYRADAIAAVGTSYEKGCLAEAVRRMHNQSTHVLYMDEGLVKGKKRK